MSRGRVLTIHGITPVIRRDRFSDRNLIETETLERYLATRPPFAPLADAVAGRGTALTIDDAVKGAADAALLARRHGHAVTLFVNPFSVETGQPHAFVLMHVLLDCLTDEACEFDGKRFPLATLADRQALRQRIRQSLARVPSEPGRLQAVRDLATGWGVADLPVPEHFRTLGREELRALVHAGVDVQNHGWSHIEHAHLSDGESAREVRDGRAWLRRELGVDAAFFAAPFGEAFPARQALAECEVWFTVSDRYPVRRLSRGVWNRVILDLPVPNQEDGELARSLRRILNWGRFRLWGRA